MFDNLLNYKFILYRIYILANIYENTTDPRKLNIKKKNNVRDACSYEIFSDHVALNAMPVFLKALKDNG